MRVLIAEDDAVSRMILAKAQRAPNSCSPCLGWG